MCHSHLIAAITAALLLGLLGCQQDMRHQARYEAGAAAEWFPDGRADRAPIEGTVSRDTPPPDPHLDTGRVDGALADTFPFAITAEDITRGRLLHDIHCAPCHDPLGSGHGIVVRQGHPPAGSYHDPRLRDAPAGYLVETMHLGRGQMPPFGDRLAAADRWRITAWIRVLQRSQHVPIDALDPDERAALEALP